MNTRTNNNGSDAPDLTADYVLGRRWMRRAPCAYTDNPDAWFPENEETPGTTDAMAVCRFRCPVWEECAAYAIATEQVGGICAGVLLGEDKKTNAVLLRRELAGSDLAPDLVEVFDQRAAVRARRSESRLQRSSLLAPIRLRDLIDEVAAVIGSHDGVPGNEAA